MIPIKPYHGKFVGKKAGMGITILNDHKIKMSDGAYKTATMDTAINMGENAIYCWQIMMERYDKGNLGSDMIGVVSNKCNNYGSCGWGGLIDSYGIHGESPKVYLGTSHQILKDPKYNCKRFPSRTIVTVELNCVSSTITFKLKNETIYAINLPKRKSWFPTVGLSYSFEESYESATFIPFKGRKPIKTQDVEAKDELDNLRKEIATLQQEHMQCTATISRLQTENVQINNQVLEYVQQTSLLENEKKEFVKQIATLNIKMKEQENKIKEQETLIESLQNEKKETEMENVRLHEEINKLKISNLNVNDYKNWTGEQLLHWIISLENGKFKNYEITLKKAFAEEDIDGGCIEDVDATDIKNWGVKNFRDRKAMLTHFKNLINKNKNKSAEHMNDNEGMNVPTAYV